MTSEEKKAHYQELHDKFDILVSEMIEETEALPSRTTIFELMKWSYDRLTKAKAYLEASKVS